jgi:hypothetical protein
LLHANKGGRKEDREKNCQQKWHNKGRRHLDAGKDYHKARTYDEDPSHVS